MTEKDLKNKYIFRPISLSMREIYELSKLCADHIDETVHSMLGVTETDSSIDYLHKIADRQSKWKEKKCQMFFVLSDNHVVGLASMIPVRQVEQNMIEYSVQAWAPDKAKQAEISRSFSKYMEKEVASLQDMFVTKRLFDPTQNGKMLSPDRIQFDNRKEANNSFLTYLNQTMPNVVRTIKSGFSLHRLDATEREAARVYQLFENNRFVADEYLPGFSSQCKTQAETRCFLKEYGQVQNYMTSLFYEMRFEDKPVGMIWADCRGSEACINLLVDEKEGNHGYAAESVRLLEHELFKRGVSNILIGCRQDNWRVPPIARQNQYSYTSGENELYSFLEYSKSGEDYACGHYSENARIKQTPRNKPTDNSR